MVLGFASFANAADMPVKAPTYNPPMAVGNWTGFYIGANAGWSWLSKSDAAIGGSSIVLISQPVTVPFSVGLQPDGFLGGFQFGYNYQFAPQWLVGIEADLDFADIKDSGNIGLPPGGIPAVTTSASERIKSLGTLRGRFGFLPNPALLLYGTAGLAIGQVDYSGNIVEFPTAVPTGRVFAASSSPTKAGWTIGGGIEWAFARNWSAKVEYLHYDLGSETITGAQTNPVDPTQFATYSFNTRGSIARAGINVRFGP
jgi:outer membrane immunogenic protein